MKKQALISLLILSFLFLITTLIILYGKGYRIGNWQAGKPTISKTGILVANSTPNGAQVFINGNLTTATNDTVDLLPGEYDVKIIKEGYFPWEKRIVIQKEVITKAQALLFPTAPRLESITSSGIENPVIDPSGTKLAFKIASQSAKKNGIFIMDMSNTPVLTFQSSAKQIADDLTALFSTSGYQWSPDGQEIIASISGELETASYYLLKTTTLNDNPQNITAILPSVRDEWNANKTLKDTARMNALKKDLRKMITEDFKIMAWSSDETKILYTASGSADLPFIIRPRHIGIDLKREDRSIKEGNIYVYDLTDDINFKILDTSSINCEQGNCLPSIQWYYDSEHLISVKDKQISIMEADGTNNTIIYAGPFIDNYVFPWPNASKIVILTNFNNQGVPPNLYTIGLK